MKILLYGASGMIGSGTLIESLEHPDVEEVIVVGRRPCGIEHERITEVVTPDVTDLSSIADRLPGIDACIYSLGVSAAGMSEEAYTQITRDLTIAVATRLLAANPRVTFVFVSGQGTSTEKGAAMWARVKGQTEADLLAMGFEGAWMFRPGYIQPLKGVRSSTRMYNVAYAITGPFYPILRRVARKSVMSSVQLGLALLRAARVGAPKSILEVPDILALAEEEQSDLASRAG